MPSVDSHLLPETIWLKPEIRLDDQLFGKFADLIYQVSGIRLDESKKVLLATRLMKRLRALDISELRSYYRLVKDEADEQVEMINCISTNTTHFFREWHHFEYLENTVLPGLLGNRSAGEPLRVWSAGCSTGEEPYSIAISLHRALGRRGDRASLKILATDISTRVLQTAESGIYDRAALEDVMTAETLKTYFLRGGPGSGNEEKLRVKDFVREMVSFRRLNFRDEAYPFNRQFDAIFCRNVIIYFDDRMKRHVLSRFHHHLSDEGHLFLGHAESIVGIGPFSPVHVTTYKKI